MPCVNFDLKCSSSYVTALSCLRWSYLGLCIWDGGFRAQDDWWQHWLCYYLLGENTDNGIGWLKGGTELNLID